MNRTKQMMKQTENSGTLNVRRNAIPGCIKGKAGLPAKYPPRLSRQVVGTGLALLLSAGMCSGVQGETISFTYTVVANTCTLRPVGTTTTAPFSGTGSTFDIDWGSVTSQQLFSGTVSKKSFGISMDCFSMLPYKPSLTITGNNVIATMADTPLYVSGTTNGAAGFAVMAAPSGTEGMIVTEVKKTTSALQNQGTPTPLIEDTNTKTILLTAWPTLMPGKKITDLTEVADISSQVTLNISYN